jgi:hypothetical protein
VLIEISHSARIYYFPNKPKPKSDGQKGTRQTYRVAQPLRDIQENIKNAIFYNVEFPFYLQGGIKDVRNPRDYVRNASLHAGNRVVVKEDIADFFPSITAKHVFRIWKDFFGFSRDVSKVLTNLTTYKGIVPQGAKTSSYIANLVFWDKEPELESDMRSNSLTYTRLIDDVTVSAKRYVNKSELQQITEAVYRMMLSSGFRPKRRKRRVMTSGSRISIHNLNTNSGSSTLSRQDRSKIRSDVKKCENSAKSGLNREVYEKVFASVRGRVAHLARFHPGQARKYVERLELIKPDKIYEGPKSPALESP